MSTNRKDDFMRCLLVLTLVVTVFLALFVGLFAEHAFNVVDKAKGYTGVSGEATNYSVRYEPVQGSSSLDSNTCVSCGDHCDCCSACKGQGSLTKCKCKPKCGCCKDCPGTKK